MAQSSQVATSKKQSAEKMPLWKIIVLAVSLTIIAALIITIIVFACVKVKLTPNVNFNAEYGITVNYNSDEYKGAQSYKAGSTENLAVINKLNNGFSTSLLNSFTQGFNSKNAYTIKYQSSSAQYSNIKSSNKYVICFMFAADQSLKTAKGETFKDSNDNPYSYRQMVVLLNDDNKGFGELEIYFMKESNNFTSSNVKLTAYGDFSDVLNYLNDLAKEM